MRTIERFERKPLLKLILVSPFPSFFLFILPLYLLRFDQSLPQFLPEVGRIFGGLIFIIGFSLTSWCVYLFLNVGKGTPAPIAPPQKLVIVGPYRYVRSPIIIGELAILLGEALWFASTAVLLYFLVSILVAVSFVTLWEEQNLEKRFGKPYLDYKKRVPRWLPKLPEVSS